MSNVNKLITTTVLIVLLLITCSVLFSMAYISNWFNSYYPFSGKQIVAQFTISAPMQDADGKFVELTLQPINQANAMVYLFNPEAVPAPTTIEKYKLYGDSVYVGGTFMRFTDNKTLFNFDGVYKLTTVSSRYNLDVEAEQKRKYPTDFTINGGVDSTWNFLNSQMQNWPFSILIGNSAYSTPSPIATGENINIPRTYNLYVTESGFVPERVK